MKTPRNLSADEFIRMLRRYGYEPDRQTGSHITLTSTARGYEHHLTVPQHRPLRVGTLNTIIRMVGEYLDRDRDEVAEELFGR